MSLWWEEKYLLNTSFHVPRQLTTVYSRPLVSLMGKQSHCQDTAGGQSRTTMNPWSALVRCGQRSGLLFFSLHYIISKKQNGFVGTFALSFFKLESLYSKFKLEPTWTNLNLYHQVGNTCQVSTSTNQACVVALMAFWWNWSNFWPWSRTQWGLLPLSKQHHEDHQRGVEGWCPPCGAITGNDMAVGQITCWNSLM